MIASDFNCFRIRTFLSNMMYQSDSSDGSSISKNDACWCAKNEWQSTTDAWHYLASCMWVAVLFIWCASTCINSRPLWCISGDTCRDCLFNHSSLAEATESNGNHTTPTYNTKSQLLGPFWDIKVSHRDYLDPFLDCIWSILDPFVWEYWFCLFTISGLWWSKRHVHTIRRL